MVARRIRGLLRPVLSQDRALANAREASTLLARQSVEREEVRLFLEALAVQGREAYSA
jgi:hypothetical protein